MLISVAYYTGWNRQVIKIAAEGVEPQFVSVAEIELQLSLGV